MATLLSTSIILVFLLIILGITFQKPIIHLIRKHRDTKLRMWCIKQAAQNPPMDQFDGNLESYSSSPIAIASSAEFIYLFIKEHVTFLSDQEKEAIFPEKYKKKDDS